ncbi:MAG: hypothetical protein A2V83_11680 [Nitrospirae bacterium RBG_16_64_22]|nr:MAG: hypothetical protein A2V83_11680 [Nitrospirae bacterium RBG_16_64_22]
MRIGDFEWDDGNVLHLALGHGIEPDEAEEVLAIAPLVRKTKKGHYAAFGRTQAGRLLVIVFEKRASERVRVITGWDMSGTERRYYQSARRGAGP